MCQYKLEIFHYLYENYGKYILKRHSYYKPIFFKIVEGLKDIFNINLIF